MVKYRLLLTLAVLMMSAACGDASRTENVAQDDGTEGDEIPAVPLGELEESSVPQSLDGLVAEAHAVVRGRFLPGPTEAGSQVERTAGIDEVVSIWDFRVEEILRNTYRSDFALSGSETIHVASLGRRVGNLRSSESFEAYAAAHPSALNFNSYPTDRSVVIFVRPGLLAPGEEAPPDLQVVVGRFACFDAATLEGPCNLAADLPGRPAIGKVQPGAAVPSFSARELTEAIQRSNIVVTMFPDRVSPQYATAPLGSTGHGGEG